MLNHRPATQHRSPQLMQQDQKGFSVVVAVGPGDQELLRLDGLLEGLATVEAGNLCQVILVDDSGGRWDFSTINHYGLERVLSVHQSPRAGRGDGWRGGLTSNILFGFRIAIQSGSPLYVVKLDTDSMILRPFHSRLAAYFNQRPEIGVVGSCYQYDLHGDPVAPSTWKINLKKHAKLLRFRRNPFPRVEQAFVGRKALIRRLLLKAVDAQWNWGACAQGGGYAVSRSLLRDWANSGVLVDDLLWVDTEITEDVVTSLLCFASGYRVADYNQRDGVFGVQYIGLGYSVDELFERGYGVIHSTKTDSWEREREIRSDILAIARSENRQQYVFED